MVGVGDQGLRVENIAPKELANGHGQVDEQADARDAHAGVIFVLGGQVDVVVVMVVMTMASMAPFLGRHSPARYYWWTGNMKRSREQRSMSM